jgi:hypothetical protein
MRRDRASLALLHPALAGDPANRLATAGVDKCLGIFLGQAARPFLKSLPGELSTFEVGILKRSTELCTTATIEFVPDGLRDELAAVFLSPVNVSDKVVGQGDRHTFDAGHFILQV